MGVTLVAALFAAWAVLLGLVLAHWEPVFRILGRAESEASAVYLATGVLALVAGSTALGFFAGVGWGWWAAGALALFQALQHALILVVLPDLGHLFGQTDGAVEHFVLEQLGRSVGWFLLVVYLHGPGVVDFFDLHGLPRRRVLLLQTVAAAGLVFLVAVAWAL